MDINIVLQTCTALVVAFRARQNLREFELLAYEQACRILETTLKEFRETWEEKDEELGNFS
jgi:hypothetical protein